jgi:lipoprotein signal peptidase
MPDRSYRGLFWGLTLGGALVDQISKYGVFQWLYPVNPRVPEVKFPLVEGVFEVVTQFTGAPETGGGPLGVLRRLGGDTLPKVNPGACFGWAFTLPPETSNLLFALVSIVAAAAIVFWALRPAVRHDRGLLTALGLILAGTLGNLYDRVVFGGVRDFLHLHYYDAFDWPVFNVADSCLVCGAMLLLLQAILGQSLPADQQTPPGSDASRKEMAQVP